MILADTGLWLALANRRDRHHAAARRCVAGLKEGLITTWPVLTETCHLLLARLGGDAQIRFVRSVAAGALSVFTLTPEHSERIAELMLRYADLPMDLADASLVVLAEHLKHGRILSTDRRDFGAYRWKEHHPFENLLVASSG